MSQVHEGTITIPAGAALSAHRRVKIVSNVLQYCGATDIGIGTLVNDTFADSNMDSGFTNGTVQLWCDDSTRRYSPTNAITAGNTFYGAANGQVAASGSMTCGTAIESASGSGAIFEGMPIGNADVSGAVGGTTAAAFIVDSDATTPKIELSGQAGGSGDFKTTLKPEATLSGNNAIVVPEADGDTLVAVALAQTLTNKTLTSPIINTPTVKDLIEVVAATNVIAASETGSTFFLNHATEFVSTLPVPAAGLKFRFIVSGAPSGDSYTIVTNASANIIKGNIVTSQDAGGTADSETAGCDTITFADGKAVAGDMVEVFCDGTNWFAYGTCKVFDAITLTTAS